MSSKKFRLRKSLKKGLYVTIATSVGIVSTIEAIGGAANLQTVSTAVGVGAALGGLRVAINWWKVNYPKS